MDGNPGRWMVQEDGTRVLNFIPISLSDSHITKWFPYHEVIPISWNDSHISWSDFGIKKNPKPWQTIQKFRKHLFQVCFNILMACLNIQGAEGSYNIKQDNTLNTRYENEDNMVHNCKQNEVLIVFHKMFSKDNRFLFHHHCRRHHRRYLVQQLGHRICICCKQI